MLFHFMTDNSQVTFCSIYLDVKNLDVYVLYGKIL
jgi:hypothetical protein